MNITEFALKNNRTTLVLLVVLLLAGVDAFTKMPRAYDPGFVIRTAQVTTYFPGASPQRVEQLVTDKLETVIQQIPELDFVSSESRAGVSIISVNIRESYAVMRPIWDDLRRKIDSAAGDLPDGIVGPIVNDEFGDVFDIVIGVTGPDFSYAELNEFAKQSRDELLRLPDAAKVQLYGAQDERIFVEYNNARLTELSISPAQLSQMLASRNIIVAGGTVTLGRERIDLEPSGNYETLEEIRHTIIQVPGNRTLIYLKDVAEVWRGYIDPPATKIHTDGIPALALGISMREGGNNIMLGKQVSGVLAELQGAYPLGLNLDIVHFTPEEVQDKVSSFISNLLQAIAVVAAVMIVSLGLRSGMIVAALIPASMIITMLIMSFFDIGLDQISLAALIIALGMLVDNGIVMSESIMTRMANGMERVQSAIESAAELRIPLLTSSLTTSAAFLPIFLAESTTGEFTASLFKVVTITLLCSWILSLTVIPMLAVTFLKVEQQQESLDSAFYRGYRGTLKLLLRFRFSTLLIIALVFASALYSFRFIPNIFFPPSDRTYFKLELELPLGTSIETTESVVKQIEGFINDELKPAIQVADKVRGEPGEETEGVTRTVAYIGFGGMRFVLTHSPHSVSSNYALIIVHTTSAEAITGLMEKLDHYTFEHFPDLRVTMRRFENGAAIANPVEVRLSGRDTDELFSLVAQIKQKMEGIPGLRTINDDWGQRIKKLAVKIDQSRALRSGVSSEDIAVSLQAGLSGMELTQFREDDEVIPVILRSSTADRQDIGKLEAFSVYSQATGEAVPLKQVADMDLLWDASKILRRDRMKTVSIGAQLQEGSTAALAFAALKPWLTAQQAGWPPGYRYELGGEAESSGAATQSIAEKLPIAGFIIIMLLVAQFNSLRKSLIVILTIPLGLIGVIYGLILADSFFGFMTLLGVISLAGIVINNAIVLLERIQLELEVNGLPPQQAIIEAAQRRLRPILLTTATTVLGLIPLYLGGGEMWEPMAVAIIAGILLSTILTLGIIPVIYAVFYRVKSPQPAEVSTQPG
ncbi:MAG: efflux RND transporter permease subunit [gamma proteobacterium endosymbiont of Lamellibrachia anaximandri]|nr:efflux RND transporter permease subunit [gamma proteobacterium endosymbiont of Lamellibrachia anaximandri]MBL3533367.1 efflux RND transporter permease subunit [gamma proteobacterium endosymbiont of Lamellibrachia anaximandri]